MIEKWFDRYFSSLCKSVLPKYSKSCKLIFINFRSSRAVPLMINWVRLSPFSTHVWSFYGAGLRFGQALAQALGLALKIKYDSRAPHSGRFPPKLASKVQTDAFSMKSMPLLRYPSCEEMAGGAPHRIHPPESIHREEILPRSVSGSIQKLIISHLFLLKKGL